MRQSAKQFILFLISIAGFILIPTLFAPHKEPLGSLLHNPFMQKEWLDNGLLAVMCWFNYIFLVPKLFFARRYFAYIASVLLCLLFITLVPASLIHLPMPMFDDRPHGVPFFFFDNLRHIFFPFLAALFISFAMRINKRLKQTEKENLQSQLSSLKAQINPHFLFNTLNSLYYLSIEKSEKTPEAILGLSHMMRFVLTEANEDFVPVEREIEYISNYIALQRLRLGNTASLQYKTDGSAEGKSIAPLLLIPFVENAFKHGVNPEELSSIRIYIAINNERLALTVENRKVTRVSASEKSGLGIANAMRRLELIYPNRHQLSIDDKDTVYIVHLKIEL